MKHRLAHHSLTRIGASAVTMHTRVGSADDDKANRWLRTAGWIAENLVVIAVVFTVLTAAILYVIFV